MFLISSYLATKGFCLYLRLDIAMKQQIIVSHVYLMEISRYLFSFNAGNFWVSSHFCLAFMVVFFGN